MIIKSLIRRNEYRDSVILMNASKRIRAIEGIAEALVVIGTDTNKDMLKELGLLTPEAKAATANDMIVAMRVTAEDIAREILNNIDEYLVRRDIEQEVESYHSLDAAFQALPEANLAIISVPGEFAAAEARKALRRGLHVLIFSDNVPLEDEVATKQLAKEKGLLVMGPDCGVANINGVALALASIVGPGPIGIVGASGSGIQEVAALIERAGLGISQAIGSGGRDLHEVVGGATMLQGLEALDEDEETRVIVLIAKPPAPSVAQLILDRVRHCRKPVVVNFLGGAMEPIIAAGAYPAATLDDAAFVAVNLIEGSVPQKRCFSLPETEITKIITEEAYKFKANQKYLRGLFGGGTFCLQAQLILKDIIGPIYSNAPLYPHLRLKNSQESQGHSLIDLGDEEFTRGRPHPVLDPTPYRIRLAREAQDPEVAVLLLDVILGPAVHPDPAGFLASCLTEARDDARQEGRHLTVVASVCGTKRDPQNLEIQEEKLREAGVIVTPSSAQAAHLAGLIIRAAQRDG
ncbi:MAG: acyl-CoA synthetase FdrA [Chloroflexi bacterium]|nr:acyl-CoA synthetase FdrA [Chloroflexota bacterium]